MSLRPPPCEICFKNRLQRETLLAEVSQKLLITILSVLWADVSGCWSHIEKGWGGGGFPTLCFSEGEGEGGLPRLGIGHDTAVPVEATWFCGQPRVKELFVMETLQNAIAPDSAFARISRMLLKFFAMTWYSSSECPLV